MRGGKSPPLPPLPLPRHRHFPAAWSHIRGALGRYCDIAAEIAAVLVKPYSHRPIPDAFVARIKTVGRACVWARGWQEVARAMGFPPNVYAKRRSLRISGMRGLPPCTPQARAGLHRNAPDVASLSMSHFADVFLEIDRDGDGKLTQEELRLFIKRRGSDADAGPIIISCGVSSAGLSRRKASQNHASPRSRPRNAALRRIGLLLLVQCEA